jgi:alkylation response protein AidB-like acyl-CoA dehydrogenase
MDFSFTEAQSAVADLARKIFAERVTHASLKALESAGERFDPKLWGELASTGLLGTSLPEGAGGSGHGVLELCALLAEAGAAIAPVPLWSTLVPALAIGRYGSPELTGWLLPRVVAGEAQLALALEEDGAVDPLEVGARAEAAAGGFTLRGVKINVPDAHRAERVLVSARSDAGVGLFAVDPSGPGITLTRGRATTGEPVFALALDGARVAATDVLAAPGAAGEAALVFTLERALVGLAALELGVAERALRLTATYTSSRQQFERPIAMFQAVSQRAADAYIDVECIRLATYHAAFLLDAGEGALAAARTAKLWAGEAGHRVVYAAQHLHGGMGFDLDYPVHRHYVLSRHLGLTLGSSMHHVTALGARLAAPGAAGGPPTNAA